MISIATAQELRENLGDQVVKGQTCSAWIDEAIARIERHFLKPDYEAVMEVVWPKRRNPRPLRRAATQSGPRKSSVPGSSCTKASCERISD